MHKLRLRSYEITTVFSKLTGRKFMPRNGNVIAQKKRGFWDCRRVACTIGEHALRLSSYLKGWQATDVRGFRAFSWAEEEMWLLIKSGKDTDRLPLDLGKGTLFIEQRTTRETIASLGLTMLPRSWSLSCDYANWRFRCTIWQYSRLRNGGGFFRDIFCHMNQFDGSPLP
jgi:hypothetical protein